MTEVVEKYQRKDKNQAKIDSLARTLADRINTWLDERPTGSLVLSAEINANQGGLGEIFLEQKERQNLKS